MPSAAAPSSGSNDRSSAPWHETFTTIHSGRPLTWMPARTHRSIRSGVPGQRPVISAMSRRGTSPNFRCRQFEVSGPVIMSSPS